MAGVNSSETSLSDPYYGLSAATAYGLRNNTLGPLGRYFGFGPAEGSRRDQRFDARLASASGPLADLIRNVRGFAGDVIPDASRIGAEIADRGRGAYDTLQGQISGFLAALPGFQRTAADISRGAAGVTADAGRATGLARDYAEGTASRLPGYLATAGRATGLAERYANRAASPIADEDLFQATSRRVLDTVRAGAGARGLESGGGAQQMEQDAVRDIALGIRGNRVQEQLATLGALEQAVGNQAGLESAGLPTLAGYQQALAGQGQALAGQQGALGTEMGAKAAGIPIAQQGMAAVDQLGAALSQRFGIPMQAAGQLMGLLTGQVAPQLALTQATQPMQESSSKGTSVL